MQADEVRFLFAYDRWATRQVLNLLGGLDPAVWTRPQVVGERSLGEVLVHHLRASQRWRPDSSRQASLLSPTRDVADDRRATRPLGRGRGPLSMPGCRRDDFVAYMHEGVPVWQMLVHVVNHGTQHRAEAAALLLKADRPANST
jgi:uncharacterized damage-inducible protein DinB